MNSNITQDLSLFGMVTNASVLVQLVMALLLLVSLMSWWYIFIKMFVISNATRRAEEFERDFWSGKDLNTLYQTVVSARRRAGSLERIFEAGFREFAKSKRQTGVDISVVMDGTRRAMRATYQREIDRLETHLSFLATVGSVSTRCICASKLAHCVVPSKSSKIAKPPFSR